MNNKVVVAYAKFKEQGADGKLSYVPGTRRFPIMANRKEYRDQAVSNFINRVVRKGKYYRFDVYCFIEDTEGNTLHTLKGGYEHKTGHRSIYRLVHLDKGAQQEVLFSTADMELDIRQAPWVLVNLYRPQRRKGFVAVYHNETGNIVQRNGADLKWIDGKRY